MQCEDIKLEAVGALNELDCALNELGMLASSASCARNEYLNDLHRKQYLNMLTIDTRYVSNVSIGFRVRPMASHVRYKPYKTPKERHRTRSENNDSDAVSTNMKTVVDELDAALNEITRLKKAKSLESIIAETNHRVDLKSIDLGKPSEVEVVSKSIQNLRVVE